MKIYRNHNVDRNELKHEYPKFIAHDLRQRSINPNVLLVLHALSGCDSSSYIRNINKEKLFQRFFDYPARYSSIIKLSSSTPPQDAIDTAEELLINCYSFNCTAKSLDDLRGMSKCFQYVHCFFFLDSLFQTKISSSASYIVYLFKRF